MTILTSLKQLHYLVAIADHLNFTRAAEACFVTQSTLSAGLKELERILGSHLVERNKQIVLMTPNGLEVAKRARAILSATQDLVETTVGATQPMTGLLRLGVIPTIAPFLLPNCLGPLRRRYPALRLALREDLTVNLLTRIEDGTLDLALIALPFDTDHLHVCPLFDDELWLVAQRDDPFLKARSITLTPRLIDRMLILEEGHCLRDHALIACRALPPAIHGGVEATSLLTLVQMIASGLGIGLVPAMAVRSGLTRSARLVVRPLSTPRPKRTIALVGRRTTTRMADLAALASTIQEVANAAGKTVSDGPHR